MKVIRRGTLSVPLFLLATIIHAGGADPFQLREERRGSETLLWAENGDPYATRWAWIEMLGARNTRSLPALPRGLVLAPGERRLAATLSPVDPAEGSSHYIRSRSGEGDPGREPDTNVVYLLPYAHGTKHLVTQGYFGRLTHAGLQALDFDLPEGTPVHAARAGTVIGVKQDSNRGGLFAAYAQWGNSIEVMHSDATWATYAHLQKNGARVQVGQRVQAGDLLGLSGATGMANGPHLHFAVSRAGWVQPRTVATVFQTGVSQVASLAEGQTYYAYVPGKPAFKPVLAADLKDEDLRAVTRTASGGAVKFREEKIDQRVFIYCANGTARAINITVSFAQQQGVRPSTGLPYRQHVPARTELYLFAVDFVGAGGGSYQLAAQIQ
jgi:murein DD-endopeptidase MepM/ murein hydrolase activator NlpD